MHKNPVIFSFMHSYAFKPICAYFVVPILGTFIFSPSAGFSQLCLFVKICAFFVGTFICTLGLCLNRFRGCFFDVPKKSETFIGMDF